MTVTQAAAVVGPQEGGQARLEHGATATTVNDADLLPGSQFIQDEAGAADDNNNDIEREDEPVETGGGDRPKEGKEPDKWPQDLHGALTNVLNDALYSENPQATYSFEDEDNNLAQNSDQQKYLSYLDSVTDMGIVLATLTRVQKHLITSCQLELFIDFEKVDMRL